jgi:glycosyltransferase 2 family protein
MRRRLLLAMRIGVPLLALTLLAYRFGPDAFRPALAVVSPLPMLAALLLGCVVVAAHAARWRLVLHGAGLRLSRGEAIAECYQSTALNTVLPGGVGGDVIRAWRQRTGAPRGWRPGAESVLAERAVGLCLLLSLAAVVLVVTAAPWYPAAAAAALACVAWGVSRPSLRRLSRRDRAAVWAWSALALAALLGLTFVVAVTIGVADSPKVMAALGLALLAGMAVPLNLGGWGPREAAGALAASMFGLSPAVGIAFAAGYGLLATVSVLPGFVVLAFNRPRRGVRVGARQVELDTDVVVEKETPEGSPQRVCQACTPREPDAGNAVTHEHRSGRQQ